MIINFKKKIFLFSTLLLLLISSTAFSSNIYSKPENWAYFAEGTGSADLFLICPLVDLKDEFNMSLSDDYTKQKFLGALNMERGIYEENTRMYAPYYRQMARNAYLLSEDLRTPYFDIAYSDIKEAFLYYLKHENHGRPIILAGFSQGAQMCLKILEDFFRDEELNTQLVAVYALGWPLEKEFVKKNPHIKPAQNENDFGVVVAFDCEAPELNSSPINPENLKSYSINPLNWKTDSTPANKDLNLGACFTDYSGKITSEIKNFCGCYIEEGRGVLKVPGITSSDFPPVVSFLPLGSYHVYDYLFFFRNLQENVKTRIKAFETR